MIYFFKGFTHCSHIYLSEKVYKRILINWKYYLKGAYWLFMLFSFKPIDPAKVCDFKTIMCPMLVKRKLTPLLVAIFWQIWNFEQFSLRVSKYSSLPYIFGSLLVFLQEMFRTSSSWQDREKLSNPMVAFIWNL